MQRDVNIIGIKTMKLVGKYVCFLKGTFSNFARSPFTLDGHDFFCTEQYFMWKKAITFGDTEIAEKILNAGTAKECKDLGRAVRNYDDSVWSKIRVDVMYAGNLAKYTQHLPSQVELLKYPKEAVWVECNPRDKIWAIGMDEEDPRVGNQSLWQGQNLLGYVITKVRAQFP